MIIRFVMMFDHLFSLESNSLALLFNSIVDEVEAPVDEGLAGENFEERRERENKTNFVTLNNGDWQTLYFLNDSENKLPN